MWFEAHLGVSTRVEEKGGLLRGGVDVVVVGKLRKWKECISVILPFQNEDPQILL